MTRNDEIERVLEQWLSEGPLHMTDRLFEGTLARIERLPKHRFAALGRRLPTMHVNVRLAAAAVVIFLIAGAGLVTWSRVPAVGNHPSPSPAAIPSASEVAGHWFPLTTRPIPGNNAGVGFEMVIDRTSMVIGRTKIETASAWSLDGTGRVVVGVQYSARYWACHPGDTGTYAISISGDGATLTVTPSGDACAARGAILAGGWLRSSSGALASGLRPAATFRPFGAGTTGRFWHSVPQEMVLAEGDENIQIQNPSSPGGTGIIVASSAMLDPLNAACGTDPSGVAATPGAIAAWLATFPALVVSTPVPIVVGGLSGLVVDVSRTADTTKRCADDFGIWTIGNVLMKVHRDDKTRCILLDRGDGQVVVIAIGVGGSETWESVEDAMPIVDGFEFTR